MQTLPPFRLNWDCLLTVWIVGFLECSFPSAIRQEVYAFDAAFRRSLHDWCFQLWNDNAQHVACTQQPLWICRNDSAPLMGGLYGQREHIPLPPTHLGLKNSICSLARQYFCFSIQDELCFFCCFKRACLKDALDQQQATNSARRWQGRYALTSLLESDHP